MAGTTSLDVVNAEGPARSSSGVRAIYTRKEGYRIPNRVHLTVLGSAHPELWKGLFVMAMAQMNVQQVMMDTAVDMSVKTTAQMLGISEEAVTKILQVGLPMMAKMAEENPSLLKALFAQSMKMLPEPMQQFYANLAKSPVAQQRMVDEFTTMIGPMVESLNRDASRQAGSTPEQAGKALATAYPAVVQALGRANTEQTETGFARQLKNLTA